MTVDTIPAAIPYLRTDPGRVEYWRRELLGLPGMRVGIFWQGSLEHKGDRIRSVPLARFAALARVRGVALCSLQKGVGAEQLVDGSATDLEIEDFGHGRGGAGKRGIGRNVFHALTADPDLARTFQPGQKFLSGACGHVSFLLAGADPPDAIRERRASSGRARQQ